VLDPPFPYQLTTRDLSLRALVWSCPFFHSEKRAHSPSSSNPPWPEAGAAVIYLQCSCLMCEISGGQNPFETLAHISVSTFISAGLFSPRGLFARATLPDNGKLPPRYDYSIDLYRAMNVAWRALRINLLGTVVKSGRLRANYATWHAIPARFSNDHSCIVLLNTQDE
jgi:hypothetical protein